MSIEIVRDRELVDLKSDTISGGSRIAVFEYQYPIDTERIAADRRLLGLDGAEAAPYSNTEKSVIATRLRKQGFLSDNEIEVLGGRLVEKNQEQPQVS